MHTYLKVYFTALAFLSRIPIPASWQTFEQEEFAKVPHCFPLAGVTLALVQVLIAWMMFALFPLGIALSVLVGLQIFMTGAFHEDGFADFADSVGANTKEKRLEIMADSRLGTFGVSALATLILIRWSSYQYFIVSEGFVRWAVWMLVISGLSRWVTVVLLKLLPYVHASGKGIGRTMSVPGWIELGGFAGALVLGGLVLDPKSALLLCVATGIAVVISVIGFKRWLGGVNGDCLGAACVFSELLMLLAIVV